MTKGDLSSWGCPKCGCNHAPTYATVTHGQRRYRRRQCRNCGNKFRTVEELVSEPKQVTIFDLLDRNSSR